MDVDHGQAQREDIRGTKISIITILLRRAVSEIKLKRTDTTLDLSQKAKRAKEKKEKKNSEKEGRWADIYRFVLVVCARLQTSSAPPTTTSGLCTPANFMEAHMHIRFPSAVAFAA